MFRKIFCGTGSLNLELLDWREGSLAVQTHRRNDGKEIISVVNKYFPSQKELNNNNSFTVSVHSYCSHSVTLGHSGQHFSDKKLCTLCVQQQTIDGHNLRLAGEHSRDAFLRGDSSLWMWYNKVCRVLLNFLHTTPTLCSVLSRDCRSNHHNFTHSSDSNYRLFLWFKKKFLQLRGCTTSNLLLYISTVYGSSISHLCCYGLLD